jgi:hypothetical protein
VKILIISDTFSPDETAGANLLKDLANDLKKQNFLTIICARDKNFKDIINKNFNLLNVNCGMIKSDNFLLRGICEFMMPFIIWYKIKKKINQFHPDLLICYSPSIFFYYLCKKIISKHNCRSYLILRDIFPLWAINAKIIKNFLLKYWLINYLKKFCKLFDEIGVEAESNIFHLRKLKIKNKISHLPNWITTTNIKNSKEKKKNYFIFSGNFGQGQDEKKIIEFFYKLKKYFIKQNQKFSFTLLGNGSSQKKILQLRNHDEILIKKKMKFNRFIEFLSQYNFGIISLKDEIKTVNFPGKLLTYLMTGTIVILLTDKKNELSKFINKNKIGLSITKGDSIYKKMKELKKLQIKLSNNKSFFEKILKKKFSTTEASKKILLNAKVA